MHIIIGMTIRIKLIAYIGFIVMVVSIIQAIVYYKCPNCKKRLSIGGKIPNYCSECGYELDD